MSVAQEHAKRVEAHWDAIIRAKLTPQHLTVRHTSTSHATCHGRGRGMRRASRCVRGSLQNPPSTVLAGLQNEVISVLHRLNISDSTSFAFPMRHVCQQLESITTLELGRHVAAAAASKPGWVLSILHQLNIPWQDRFYVYYDLCAPYVAP